MFGRFIRTKIFEFLTANNAAFTRLNLSQEQLSLGNFKLKRTGDLKGQFIKVSAAKGDDYATLIVFNSSAKDPAIVHCEEKFAPPAKPAKS